MAARCQALKNSQVKRLIDHLRTVDGAEVAEVTVQVTFVEGADEQTLMGLAREGVPLEWIGSARFVEGSGVEGLTGAADPKVLARALIHGVSPTTGKAIKTNVRKNEDRRASYGLILAPSKAVSALLASEDETTRQLATDAVKYAQEQVVRALEKTLVVRYGGNSKKPLPVVGLLGASVIHFTSSAGDPHLHIHLLIGASALVRLPDGELAWRALDGTSVYSATALADAVFQQALKEYLEPRLDNVTWIPRQVGPVVNWEIAELTDGVDALSRARDHMADIALGKMGRELGNLNAAQLQTAWRMHRQDRKIAEKVEHTLDEALERGDDGAAALRATWREAMGAEVVERLDKIHPSIEPRPSSRAAAATDLNPLQICLEQGIFRPKDLLAAYISVYGVDVQEARRLAAGALEWIADERPDAVQCDIETLREIAGTFRQAADLWLDGERPQISMGQWNQAESWRTRIVVTEALLEEREIRHLAYDLASTQRRRLVASVTDLSPDQAQAVAVIAEGRALTTVPGVAGAGKTTMLSHVVAAAQKQGMDVQVVARNAATARSDAELLGVKATTIASFTKYPPSFSAPTLLVVEESGVIDRTDWEILLEMAKNNPNCQLVAIGDRLQVQPIDDLGTWAVVEEATRKAGASAELTKSWRCQDWEREHDLLRAADADGLVQHLISERPDAVVTSSDVAAEAARCVVEGEAASKNVVAITTDNATAAGISTAVQDMRGIRVDDQTTLRFGQKCGVGDIVRTRKNEYRYGILNGDTWQVRKVTDAGVSLRKIGGKQKILMPHDWTAENLELAYAVTADSAQGITVDRAIVVADGMGRSRLYSGATRGTEPPTYLFGNTDESGYDHLKTCLRTNDVSETLHEIADQHYQDVAEERCERVPLRARRTALELASGGYTTMGAVAIELIITDADVRKAALENVGALYDAVERRKDALPPEDSKQWQQMLARGERELAVTAKDIVEKKAADEEKRRRAAETVPVPGLSRDVPMPSPGLGSSGVDFGIGF